MFKKMLTLRHLALMAFLICVCSTPKPIAATPIDFSAPLACSLPAPSNLRITGSTVSVDWDDVPGATGYRTRVANAITGQVYYDAVSGSSSTLATGLPASTTIDISVWAICPNGDLGDEAAIQLTTNFVVIDEAGVGRGAPAGRPTTQVECGDTITEPLCLAVFNTMNRSEMELFKITQSDRRIEVRHNNPDTTVGGSYKSGWYFGSESYVPLNGTETIADVVFVYKLEGESRSLGSPIMAFKVNNTSYLTICYPAQIQFGNQTIPNNQYRVLMGCNHPNGRPSSSSSNLRLSSNPQTSPNPFQDILNVALDDANASEVSLMDANGRVVRSQSVAEGTQTLSFETADLAPGLYLLRCQGPNTVKTTKVIKSR